MNPIISYLALRMAPSGFFHADVGKLFCIISIAD